MKPACWLAGHACVAAALLSLAACDGPYVTPTSDDFALSDVNVHWILRSNGEAVLVSASVTVTDDGTPAELGGGDVLSAAAADAPERALSSDPSGGHAALLPSSATEIELRLTRGAEAVVATAGLPRPFALEVPPDPTPFDAPIALAWERADEGDTMTVSAHGPCIRAFRRRLAEDTGAYALQPGDLAFDAWSGVCELGVSVTRSGERRPLPMGPRGGVQSDQERTAAVEVTR